MRSELGCDDVRSNISALLDDELALDEKRALEAHLASCDECRAYAEQISHVRKLVRLQPVETVPDLTGRIAQAIATEDRRSRFRPYLRTASIAAAAALLVFLGTSLPIFEQPRDVATATEIVRGVQAAARDVSTYRATFEIVERGWHPEVPARRFTARVWFAAPERFRLQLADNTRYPAGGWPRNAVTLIASPQRWSISEPSSCPVVTLPACSVGAAIDERTIVSRQPFDGNSALPTDIAVPLETLSSADALEVMGSDSATHRVAMTYQQAAPLVRALQQGGSWRPFHPLDRVEVWVDRKTWFPQRFRVLAADSPDRKLWAERVGVRAEPAGRVLLEVHAVDFEEPQRLAPELFQAKVAGAVSSGGFQRFGSVPGEVAYPVPTYTAGLAPYREGATMRRSLTTFTDGMTWLKVSTLDDNGSSAAYTSGAEIIELGDGAAFYVPADERNGRSIEIYSPGKSVRVESNLSRAEVLRVAASLPVTGTVPDAVDGFGATIRRIDPAAIATTDRPGSLPPGYRLVAAVETLTGDAETLSLHFRLPETSFEGSGIRVLRSTAYEGLPPSSEEFINIEVAGRLGRWSFERSELEWMAGSVYRAVSVPGSDLATALRVAESLR